MTGTNKVVDPSIGFTVLIIISNEVNFSSKFDYLISYISLIF